MGGSVPCFGSASRVTLPNLIGLGAPKAGTTWLFRCLSEHPEVFMAPRKETNFFHAETIEGRLGEYQEYFTGAQSFRVVGEISVRYFHSPRAPERIKRHIPSARLFVSLRNPIEQVYSHYWHLHRQNFHEYDRSLVPSTFEEALERYQERLVEPAYCSRALARWLEYFDRSQIHVILFDDISARPASVLAELYAFAGVNGSFQPASMTQVDSDVRRGVSPRSPFHDRAHRFLYQHLARRLYYRLKLTLGLQRAVRLAESLRARQLMEALFYRSGYPPMSERTRAALRERFSEEVQQLSRLIGRDLSHWK